MKKLSHLKNILKSNRYVDIHITDHCDLNCQGCAHFSPVAEPFFIKLDDLEITYKKLEPVYHKFFNSIHLLGGEPLLHPQLAEIIQLTRSYFPDTEIQIITNGLKLRKMPESFWETIRDSHIKICVSLYSVKWDLDDLHDYLRQQKVSYEISASLNKFIHHILDEKGQQDPKDSYKKCKFGGSCIQLRNNKLFPCAQMAYIQHLNHAYNMHFQYAEGDYLVLDELRSRYQFYKFLLSSKSFCRYCNIDEEYYTKWNISKRKKEEWIK